MQEFYNNVNTDSVPVFEPHYNRHYITVDDRDRILLAWSDGPLPNRDTAGAICINEQGGYQFRLLYSPGFVGDGEEFPALRESEENPPLFTEDGIPLYEWGGEVAILRSEEEIAADRAAIPAPPPSPQEQLRADVDFLAAMTNIQL